MEVFFAKSHSRTVQSTEPVRIAVGESGEIVNEVIGEGWARMLSVGVSEAINRVVSVALSQVG